MNDGILQFSHKTYGFGGRFLKIRDACMDFELCFKVYNLVSIHSKITKLSQMTTLNTIFLVSVYRLVQIWNSPLYIVYLVSSDRNCWLFIILYRRYVHNAFSFFVKFILCYANKKLLKIVFTIFQMLRVGLKNNFDHKWLACWSEMRVVRWKRRRQSKALNFIHDGVSSEVGLDHSST